MKAGTASGKTLCYVIPVADAFSSYPHPYWKIVVMVHVLATPVFVFFVGSVWWGHVSRHWRRRHRPVSGVSMVVILAFVSVSGYLLNFVGTESHLGFARVAHAVGGLLATAIYVQHAIAGWLSNRRSNRLA